MGTLTPMTKGKRDLISLYPDVHERAALNALLDAIDPRIRATHGEETRAVWRMVHLGMAVYAANPALRAGLAPHPDDLVRLALSAKAHREDDAPEMRESSIIRAAEAADTVPDEQERARLAADKRNARRRAARAHERDLDLAEETPPPPPFGPAKPRKAKP